MFVPCVSCYTNPLKVVHLCLEHIHLMAMKYLTMQDAASRITNFLQYILTNIIQNTFYNIYVSNLLMHAFSDMDSTNTRSNKVSIYVREEPAVSCRWIGWRPVHIMREWRASVHRNNSWTAVHRKCIHNWNSQIVFPALAFSKRNYIWL